MKWTSVNHWLARLQRKALARALRRRTRKLRSRSGDQQGPGDVVLVISHDMFLAGAQRLLLNLLAEWQRRRPFDVKVISVGAGVLRDEFSRLYPTLVLADFESRKARDAALLEFVKEPIRAIYSSTVVNGLLLEELRELCSPIITHSHELQAAIERWAAGEIMTATLINSDLLLGGCTAVAENLRDRRMVPAERLGVVFDFVEFWDAARRPSDAELDSLREELSVSRSDTVVFGCGTTDWRKGPDHFLATAINACQRNASLKFVWIGGEESPPQFMQEVSAANLDGRIRFVGNRDLSRRYYYIGHIFALTSREDPCPLVALEAANARLPVVSFAGAGDIPRVLGEECGAVVPFEDWGQFADVVLQLAENPERRRAAGDAGFERVRTGHSVQSAALAVEEAIARVQQLPRKKLGRCDSPLVSVIVPNYNHQQFLGVRLASIARQSLRNLEIIVLDDASTDDSRSILQRFVAGDSRATLLVNEVNSGSTFKQWRKGLAAAQGKYIWIAESDDVADRRFLRRAVAILENDSAVVMAHAQSTLIDTSGKKLGRPMDWLNDVVPGRWESDVINDGMAEISGCLAQKNTIPNASAVVFRNFSGIEYLVDDDMRLCADWLFWIRLLARGKYAFIAEGLNGWRQNSSNARTRHPGVLEWNEGQTILHEVARLLKLNDSEEAKVLERFHQRCLEWSGGRLDT
jgi:glycosyltransferase involved in cell wall biosynthesis